MTIVIGYFVATVLCVAVLWAICGRRFEVARDPGVNLAELAGRHTGIMTGLAGYAVTGMVLLVTLGRSLSDANSTGYATVVTMFFVAWMAYSGTAFLFANVTDHRADQGSSARGFDVAAGQFVGAAATLEFSFGLAWLALRPLFQAFGLQRLADVVALVSVGVVLASYGLVAHHLRRAGYGPGRVVIALPVLAAAATLVYAALVGLLGLRSEEAALDLIIAGFGVGSLAFFFVITLVVTAGHGWSARFLARFGRYLIIGYVQANVVLVGFLLLAILGLA